MTPPGTRLSPQSQSDGGLNLELNKIIILFNARKE